MTIEFDAVNVAPPRADVGVFCRANTTSSVRYTIPSGWKGMFVTITSRSDDIWILFGGSSVAITQPQVSGLAGEDLTANAATGYFIPAGARHDVLVPDDDSLTKFAVYGSGSTGHWFAYASVNTRVRP